MAQESNRTLVPDHKDVVPTRHKIGNKKNRGQRPRLKIWRLRSLRPGLAVPKAGSESDRSRIAPSAAVPYLGP